MPRKRRSRPTGKTKEAKTRETKSSRNGVSAAESFGLLADGLGIGLALCDAKGMLRFNNATFDGLLDVHTSAAKNLRLLDRLRSDSRSDFATALERGTWGAVNGKLELLSRDGRLRTFHVSLSPFDKRGADAEVWILAHEVTELLETGRALDDSKGNISFLTARLMQAQDAERRRMARDLHDITGQELAVILMSLNRLANGIGTSGFDPQAELGETISLVRKVENEIRTLSYLLHPPMLDELGLKSALGWYVEGFSKRSKIQVKMDISESLPRLSLDKEIALFRVVQESLTNVLRHSHSDSARIHAEARDGRLLLFVADAGQGFPAGMMRAGKSRKAVPGVGILGMRERLQQLGGSLSIESTPGGTHVRASVPLDAESGEPGAQGVAASEPSSDMEGPFAEPVSANSRHQRILIADDHELMRIGIHSLLDTEPNLEVCGEAADGMEAVAKVRELKPDLVILDLMMPRLGGFSAAKEILEVRPATKILAFTNYSFSQIESMLHATGCHGYVSKSRASTDLIVAIRAVLAGGTFLQADTTQAAHTKSA